MKKQIRLRECGELQCGSVDEAQPVVPHVKILGWGSRNRRQYLPESVEARDYEDISVNLNHPDGPNKSRIVQERFGWFENVVKENDGLFGDLRYNPKLPYAEAFAWWAKNKPNKIGMSHDAVGQGVTKNGVFIVEKALPKSVDLVADPASTRGLHESMESELNGAAVEKPDEELDDLETHVKNAVSAICTDDKLDMKAKIKKIKAALKLLEEPESEVEEEEDEEEEEEEEPGKVEESLKQLMGKVPGVKKLVEELDTVKTKLAVKERHELATKLIEEAKLPKIAVTPVFLRQLTEAKDEASIKQLIEDRKQIATIQKPKCSGPIASLKEGQIDNKSFAKIIREGR